MSYDNAKAQKQYKLFKTRLTRALNAARKTPTVKTWDKVIAEVNAFEKYYETADEPWPDFSNRWMVAREDAQREIRRCSGATGWAP